MVLICRLLPDHPKWKQITKPLTYNKHLSLPYFWTELNKKKSYCGVEFCNLHFKIGSELSCAASHNGVKSVLKDHWFFFYATPSHILKKFSTSIEICDYPIWHRSWIFFKNFQTFLEVKFYINRVILTPCPARCPLEALKMSIFLAFQRHARQVFLLWVLGHFRYYCIQRTY